MKILIVDDNEQMRTLLTLTFAQHANHEILQATNGEEALNIVNQCHPEVILLDVKMSGELDGIEVCRRIKSSINKDIAIILISANTEMSCIENGVDAGADMYLSKPFSPIHLLQIIETFQNNAKPDIQKTMLEAPSELKPPTEMLEIYSSLPGLNAERLYILEKMFGGSQEKVFETVKQFLNGFQDSPQEIKNLLETAQNDLACNKLHTLKGSAFTIGANEIANLAAEIESIVKNSGDANEKISELYHAWDILVDTVNHFNTTDLSAFENDLTEIAGRLQNDELISPVLLESLKNNMKLDLLNDDVELLIKKIKSYDYESALVLIQKLLINH